jgi:hypothetical protein
MIELLIFLGSCKACFTGRIRRNCGPCRKYARANEEKNETRSVVDTGCCENLLLSTTSSMEMILIPLLMMQSPITRWPFFVFLGGAMFCLLASATCHLFGCLSQRYFYALMRMDYAGISTLIAASFYPPVRILTFTVRAAIGHKESD